VALFELAFLIGTVVGGSAEALETTVLAKVDAFAEAFRDGDVETIEGLLGSRYSHCNSDGSRPTKDQRLEWFSTRAREIRSGRFVFSEYRNDDIQIQIHETIAVTLGFELVEVSEGNAVFETEGGVHGPGDPRFARPSRR
jgi:hypothetical protein